MYQRNWIDKLIKHNRDTVGDFGSRVMLHIPIGVYMGFFPLSRGLRELFLRYEESEDKWVKDQAWKDYAGAMVGYVIGRAIMWLVVALIIKEVIK